MSNVVSSSLINELSRSVAGAVLAPSDADFRAHATGFNLAVSHRPAVVVVAHSAADVLAAVRVGIASGTPVFVQATGHGALLAIERGILIDTSRLDGLSIDPQARTATLQAGVRWRAVVAAAAPHGLAPITGSSPTVGAVGFLLGGGLGPLARSHGFGSDQVLSFELVTGHGELVKASTSEHAELFWALRGGKGGLGIVTSVVIRLVELPALYAGSLLFDFAEAEAVLAGWIEWAKMASGQLTTSLGALRFPALDAVPEPLRGRHLLSLRFAFPGTRAEGEAFAAPLRTLAPVYVDELGVLPIADVDRIHNDPTEPSPGWVRGLVLQGLNARFAATLVRLLGDDPELPFIGVELRSLGGATRGDVSGGSAVGGRAADWIMTVIGVPDVKLFAQALPDAFATFHAAIEPWLAPHTQINWADENDPAQFAAAWPAETGRRLVEIRAKYDPHGIFPYGPGALRLG